MKNQMIPKIKVLVVDDHAIVREGLKSLIELDEAFEVVDEVASSMECLRVVPDILPDVILMDLKMPGIDGIEGTRLVKTDYPQIKVILLTNYDDEEYIIEAIKAGADGYVLKDVKQGELLKIIRMILENQAFIDPRLTRKVFHQLIHKPTAEEPGLTRPILTQRELQVLLHLVEGKSNREIADAVCLSPDTVKSHLKNIYQKMGARNRSHASKIALQKKIVRLGRG